MSTTLASNGVFNREICALLATLVIFSLTYMMRGVWNLKHEPNTSEFVGILEGISIGLLCDFAPLMFLLIFHFKNFSTKNESQQAQQDRNGSAEA